MSVKPITPKEAREKKTFPDAVVETWNTMITEKVCGGYATIKQNEIVARLANTMDVSEETVFDKGWLEVEDFYRNVGWKVVYDKPVYNESYGAFFNFSPKQD